MDKMQATPQDPRLALLSKALGLAASGTGSVGEFLGVPAMQRTAERLSYGEPLTTGSGFATQMRPDTMEVLLSLGAPSAKAPKTAFKGLLSLGGGADLGEAAFNAGKPDLHSFGTKLKNRVQQRVAESQTKSAMRDWAYQEGTQLLSQKTGNTLTILGKRVDPKGRSMYLIKAQHPNGDEATSFYEEGALLADKNIRPLNNLPADAQSVQDLLKQIAK